MIELTKNVMIGAEPDMMLMDGHLPSSMREPLREMSYAELANFYKKLRAQRDAYKSMESKLREIEEIITIEVIPTKLTEDDIHNITVNDEGGNKVRWQTAAQLRCSIKAEFREDMYRWLEETGNESLITDTVNASTLKAFVKRRIKDGKPVPEEYLNLHPYEQASLVRA